MLKRLLVSVAVPSGLRTSDFQSVWGFAPREGRSYRPDLRVPDKSCRRA